MKRLQNIFSHIPANPPEELFEEQLSNDKLKIERIISRGQCTPPGEWYDQETDEWVLLITGEAILTLVENQSIHLQPGDYLHIAPHVRHRVEWTPPDVDSIWLAIHF